MFCQSRHFAVIADELSHVPQDPWPPASVAALAQRSARWLVTRGEHGADEITTAGSVTLPAEKVHFCLSSLIQSVATALLTPKYVPSHVHVRWTTWPRVSCKPPVSGGQHSQYYLCAPSNEYILVQVIAVDTNGAGDTFATAYMLALMQGRGQPGSVANWAAAQAVSQPQVQGSWPKIDMTCIADVNSHGQSCKHLFTQHGPVRASLMHAHLTLLSLLQACKPKCVETAIRAALRQGGIEQSWPWLPSRSLLRASVSALADSCTAVGRQALERAQRVMHGPQKASTVAQQSHLPPQLGGDLPAA